MKTKTLSALLLSLLAAPALVSVARTNTPPKIVRPSTLNSTYSTQPAPGPTNQLFLNWDYPYDSSNIVFEVWHAQNLGTPETTGGSLTWTLFTNVAAPPVALDNQSLPMDFYIVRASNTVSGLVSDWGQ